MIPLRDENPTHITPVVTWALVAANVVVFVLQLLGSNGQNLGLMAYAMVPFEITRGLQVRPFPPVEPAWITVFTSMFMHGGLMHIGFNMLYLLVFGNNIEDRLGHGRFLLFYLGCGVAASLAQVASAPASVVPMLGASGAVAGVLGAYLVLYPRASVICLLTLGFFWTTTAVPAVLVLGFWIVGQLFSASLGSGGQVGGGIAYWAHIGGFFCGLVLMVMLGGLQSSPRRRAPGRW